MGTFFYRSFLKIINWFFQNIHSPSELEARSIVAFSYFYDRAVESNLIPSSGGQLTLTQYRQVKLINVCQESTCHIFVVYTFVIFKSAFFKLCKNLTLMVDNLQIVFQLSCLVRHPVDNLTGILYKYYLGWREMVLRPGGFISMHWPYLHIRTPIHLRNQR